MNGVLRFVSRDEVSSTTAWLMITESGPYSLHPIYSMYHMILCIFLNILIIFLVNVVAAIQTTIPKKKKKKPPFPRL